MNLSYVGLSQRSREISQLASIFLMLFTTVFTTRIAYGALVTIPENQNEGGAEIISITNYTWTKSSKISICETQLTKDCDANVKFLSDKLSLFNIGAPGGGQEAAIFFFSDEFDPGLPVTGQAAADIFLSEADGLTNNGKFPPILFGAKDINGNDQVLQLIIFSDPNPNNNTPSDSIDITAVQVPGQPVPPDPIIVTTVAIPEPPTIALLLSWLPPLILFIRRRAKTMGS